MSFSEVWVSGLEFQVQGFGFKGLIKLRQGSRLLAAVEPLPVDPRDPCPHSSATRGLADFLWVQALGLRCSDAQTEDDLTLHSRSCTVINKRKLKS